MKVESIDRIVELSETKLKEVSGFTYSDKPLHLVKLPAQQSPFCVYSLISIVDYLKANVDKLSAKDVIINVMSHQKVQVVSNLNKTFERSHYILADVSHHYQARTVNEMWDIETFIVILQSCFAETDEKAELLKLVSNMTDEVLINSKDDGISQSVAVKTGIQKLENVKVPNPVTLYPIVSFPDIPKRDAEYIFRAKKGSNGITLGLYEYDREYYKLLYMEDIKQFLKNNCMGYAVI